MNFLLRKRTKNKALSTPKDTLIIIGNGFDIWQGLHTNYAEFQKYYLSHRDEILRKLHLKKTVVRYEDGETISISDVELIYGDPFDPKELESDFWSVFENSLSELDAERLNYFFGKDRRDLREMRKRIRNANRILREAFCSWIATITIDNKNAGYQFGDNCLFINFNYTDTLLKRFAVKEENEWHIHGEATDKDSIIFGHSAHPELPEPLLYRMGGRFRGLYFVEEILYETDKHVRDNLYALCMFLAVRGVIPEQIKNVYVLGHSMGLPDVEYFSFLADATTVHSSDESVLEAPEEVIDENLDPLGELYNRLQYAINHTSPCADHDQINEAQEESVARRFEKEQSARNQEFERIFMKFFGKPSKKSTLQAEESRSPRTEDAIWHISYYSEKDKRWAETLMDALGCKNVQLYSSIDECLKSFKEILDS